MDKFDSLSKKYFQLRNRRHDFLVQNDSLNRKIQEQDRTISEKNEEIEDLNRRLNAQHMQLEAILNSKRWRALEKVRKLMPPFSYSEKQPAETTTNKASEKNRKVGLPKWQANSYKSHFEPDYDFSKHHKTDIKVLAFYLPQFHAFKENDEWWGKGFTEWTNTRSANPRFPGHYQPREPHADFGYYTLDNKEIFKKQINLAKRHGIYGFAFYYYWFSGKQLMDKSMNIWLENKDLDFPFCLCWANENWVRTWDGQGEDILIEQKYKRDDPVKFIQDIKKYLVDPRYIRVDGKPVILVYEPKKIPDFPRVIEAWRKTAKAEGIGEILVWSKSNIIDGDFSNSSAVDAEFDFAPNSFNLKECSVSENKTGLIYDYEKIVDNLVDFGFYADHATIKPFYYSCTTGWDNSSRRKDSAFTVFTKYSPKSFYKWLRTIVEETRERNPKDKRFIFINAWNEWAEGTYLEPDKKFGYTNINTLSRAIYDLPEDSNGDDVA